MLIRKEKKKNSIVFALEIYLKIGLLLCPCHLSEQLLGKFPSGYFTEKCYISLEKNILFCFYILLYEHMNLTLISFDSFALNANKCRGYFALHFYHVHRIL